MDTPDGFKCGCKAGWQLAKDGKSCEGTLLQCLLVNLTLPAGGGGDVLLEQI